MRQESHRIYWQKWSKNSSDNNNNNNKSGATILTTPTTKRDLITSSAAIRLSDAAKAKDVTSVLRQSMKLGGSNNNDAAAAGDALVLVGTLYNITVANHHHQQQPLHVIKTLAPSQNPLEIRDAMNQNLALRAEAAAAASSTSTNNNNNNSTTTTVPPKQKIAPKLQWFYIPNDPNTNIPAYIELDGNSVGMDSDPTHPEGEEDDDDEQQGGDDEVWMQHELDLPWRKTTIGASSTENTTCQHDELNKARATKQRHLKNVRRYHQLASYRSVQNPFCVSGTLWKQSFQDPHVWSKVQCILTEDYLWYGLRRIRLTRALLLEPPQKQRLPYGIQLVSETGIPHFFRASSKQNQLQWISSLSERIVQSHENQLMEQAELIVTDETMARNMRMMQNALLGGQQEQDTRADKNDNDDDDALLLRWSLQVAEYKEECRHLSRRLPSKKVVRSSSRSPPSSSTSLLSLAKPSVRETAQLDSDYKALARSLQEKANQLLTNLTIIMSRHRQQQQNPNLEQHCRKIEYVLTGRFRLSNSSGDSSLGASDDSNAAEAAMDRDGAPPMNLFDKALDELRRKETPRVA